MLEYFYSFQTLRVSLGFIRSQINILIGQTLEYVVILSYSFCAKLDSFGQEILFRSALIVPSSGMHNGFSPFGNDSLFAFVALVSITFISSANEIFRFKFFDVLFQTPEDMRNIRDSIRRYFRSNVWASRNISCDQISMNHICWTYVCPSYQYLYK